MYDIIGFHAATERTLLLGGLGLSTFLLLTNLFNCTVSEKRGFRQFARDKMNRLVYPWLFWCAVYGAENLFVAFRHDKPLSEVFNLHMLLYGTSDHLWFVPFALVSALAVALAQGFTSRMPHAPVVFGSAGVGAVMLFVSATLLGRFEFNSPFDQYLYALPSALIGFAMGRSLLIESVTERQRVQRVFCVAAAVFGCVAVAFAAQWFPVRYAVSAILVMAAVARPGTADWLTDAMTPLLFGIYLVHPLVIWVTKRSDVFDSYIAPYAVGVLVLSAVTVWCVRKTPLNRFT